MKLRGNVSHLYMIYFLLTGYQLLLVSLPIIGGGQSRVLETAGIEVAVSGI